MTMIRETRAVNIQAEVRAADDGEALAFTGHAAVFNERTWIGPKRWGFWEEIDPGFFDDVLEDDAAFLVNHDPNIVLARNPTTMTLSVDGRGLVADANWDSADADAVKWAGRVRRRDASQMSFAFTVAEEKWSEDDAGNEIRTLLKAERLYDVSLVTYPAYDGTDAAMRDSAAEVVKRHRGVDPRLAHADARPVRSVTPEAAAEPAATPTEPLPVEVPTPDLPVEADPEVVEADPIVEPVTDPAAEVPPVRSLLQLRQEGLAAFHRLPA